jgi:hypothetical protein
MVINVLAELINLISENAGIFNSNVLFLLKMAPIAH